MLRVTYNVMEFYRVYFFLFLENFFVSFLNLQQNLYILSFGCFII